MTIYDVPRLGRRLANVSVRFESRSASLSLADLDVKVVPSSFWADNWDASLYAADAQRLFLQAALLSLSLPRVATLLTTPYILGIAIRLDDVFQPAACTLRLFLLPKEFLRVVGQYLAYAKAVLFVGVQPGVLKIPGESFAEERAALERWWRSGERVPSSPNGSSAVDAGDFCYLSSQICRPDIVLHLSPCGVLAASSNLRPSLRARDLEEDAAVRAKVVPFTGYDMGYSNVDGWLLDGVVEWSMERGRGAV